MANDFYNMDLIYDWSDTPLIAKIIDVFSVLLVIVAVIEVILGCIMLYGLYITCYTFEFMK